MSAHWRLAVRGAVLMAALAVPAAVVILYVYGKAHAGAFSYGVGTSIVCFVSTALTVSLLTGRSHVWRVMGVASFVARYGFVVGALGIPAYLGLWPVVAMLGGFAGVYLAEPVVLVPGMLKVASRLGMKRSHVDAVRDGVERRVEV
jgi:hypothetical protein